MEAILIAIFVLGYAAIALEHPLKINKAASALLTGVLVSRWVQLRILVTFCTQAMIGSANTSRTLYLRVFLCLATLFALCTSNNVGLSFLPLPLVANQIEVQKPTDQKQLSRSPSQSDNQSVRVPITTYSQKRESKQPPSPPLAGALKTGSVVSNETRVFAEFNSAAQLYVCRLRSQPPGRAPPI